MPLLQSSRAELALAALDLLVCPDDHLAVEHGLAYKFVSQRNEDAGQQTQSEVVEGTVVVLQLFTLLLLEVF